MAETKERDMVVVASDEGITVQWNPLATKQTTIEIEPGNFMTHYRPIDEKLGALEDS
jgi:hypothetical protein